MGQTPNGLSNVGELGKSATSYQNVYQNPTATKNLMNQTRRNLNILNKGDGTSIISVQADPTKHTVVKNLDGTTSFN